MPRAERSSASEAGAAGRVRFDKWLWAARFYKTRALAAQAIDSGQARLGDARVKPAHSVTLGACVEVRKQGLAWSVEVIGLSDRRGSAQQAALLYRETPSSIATREQAIAQRKAALAAQPELQGRPTKRDRRKLEDFLNEP
jgi:ribosome-associated heat shock protein Hsp15